MTVIINGTTGITNVNGSAAAPAETGTDTDTGIVYGTNTVTIATNGTAGLIQNASQNLGAGGLTPSTWSAGKALEVGFAGTGLWSFSAVENYLLMNAYYNGGWKYASSAPASYYNQYNSGHYFASAPTGTIGNAITFTPTLVWGKDTTVALQGSSSVSGTGISFPATQSASSDANTLDDYEEGTWTPTVGGTSAYSSNTGYYIKVGRLVTAWFDFTISTIGTGATAYIYGLPFTASGSNGQAGSVSYWTSISQSAVIVTVRVDSGSATIFIGGNTAASNTVNPTFNIFQNNSRIIGTVTYYANA